MSEPLAALVAELTARALRQARRRAKGPIEAALDTQFDRVLAIDSSTVALRDAMRAAWRACAKAKAALKLHAIVNVLTIQAPPRRLEPRRGSRPRRTRARARLVPGRAAALRPRVLRLRALCLDRLRRRVLPQRAKSGFNPRIVRDLGRGPGRRAPIRGLKLKQALGRTERSALDVLVELTWWRKRGKGRPKEKCTLVCRVVAIRDDRGRVWTYITNLDAELWRPDEIASLYSTRWQVELLYRAAKSQAEMCWQPSAKEHLVRLRIDATLLGLALCGRLCALARRAQPEREFSLARGVAALRALAPGLLVALCAPWSRAGCAWEAFVGLARDPNLIRSRSRDVFVLNSRLADAA